MSKPLFNDFEGVTSKAWKQKIQVDLKGADYNEALIWHTYEGIDVKPFYHPDEFGTLPNISASKATNWKVCQTITVNDAKKENINAIDAISRGADSLFFILNSKEISITELTQNIDLNKITIHLKCNFITEDLKRTDKAIIPHVDIIHNLAKTGNWFKNLNEDYTELESIVSSTNHLSIDATLYQNSGANCVQQLAYAIAHSNEYLNHLDSKLSNEAKSNLKVSFNIAVGSNYFFEIAKLRALRQLWSTLATAYGINTDCTINVTPSHRNKTIYDYNVNMLRTTTECMSAILGGADSISNLPYDNLYHNSNEFGDRIARNQLLVLKNESYFDKVNNPVDGAYYIEYLTEQLANKSLQLFKDIESNGGFLNQLKEGTIQRKIKENASKEQADFDCGKLVLLGTNKHPNPNDQMKNELEIKPFLKIEKRKTLIEPIIEKRLSENLEINRLKEE